MTTQRDVFKMMKVNPESPVPKACKRSNYLGAGNRSSYLFSTLTLKLSGLGTQRAEAHRGEGSPWNDSWPVAGKAAERRDEGRDGASNQRSPSPNPLDSSVSLSRSFKPSVT